MDDIYKEYSKELRNLIDKSNESFEKQLNYISAGALGLSMIVVEKIVKDLSKTTLNSILIASWCFLGLTLISNLLSHIYTSRVHGKTISEISGGSYNYEKAVKRNGSINLWNIFSITLLLLGIFFQITFITINIDMSQEKPITKPAPPPDTTRGFPGAPPPKPSIGIPSTPPPPSTPKK